MATMLVGSFRQVGVVDSEAEYCEMLSFHVRILGSEASAIFIAHGVMRKISKSVVSSFLASIGHMPIS